MSPCKISPFIEGIYPTLSMFCNHEVILNYKKAQWQKNICFSKCLARKLQPILPSHGDLRALLNLML